MQSVIKKKTLEKQALTYSGRDVVPREIGRRLLEHIDPIRIAPGRFLDVCAGAAPMYRALRKRFPEAQGTAVDLSQRALNQGRGRWPWRRPQRICADAMHLPIRNDCIDLAISNLGVAEIEHLDQAYAEMARIQVAGGLLAFATLGPDTFRQLRDAWQSMDPRVELPPFMDMHDHGDLLVNHGYTGVVLDTEHLEVTFPDVATLLDELRELGAINLGPGRCRTLRGRNVHERLALNYPQGHVRPVSLTIEVVYGHAWRAERAGSRPITLS
jgi:malonyl-CoA O-methyltransferase